MKKKELNEAQKLFCIEYVRNGFNAMDAYRYAYPKSLNSRTETLQPRVSRLKNDPRVLRYLDELRRPAEEEAGISFKAWLKDMETLKAQAAEKEAYGAAVQAHLAIGRACGFLVVRRKEEAGRIEISWDAED